MANEPKPKYTQLGVLLEIRDLLIPMSNLAKFNIQQLNNQIAAEEAAAKEVEPKTN